MQKNRVKIAFFLPYLEVGGIEKLYVSYVNHLVAYFDVFLITCCADGAYREMISNKVNISLIPQHYNLTLFISS